MADIYLAINGAMAALLVLVGGFKISSPAAFAEQLTRIGIKHYWLAICIAYGLHSIEILIGLIMWTRPGNRMAILASALLLIAFTLFLLWAMLTKRDIPCFYFGSGMGKRLDTPRSLVHTGFLLAIVGWLGLESSDNLMKSIGYLRWLIAMINSISLTTIFISAFGLLEEHRHLFQISD
jgi:hypothetical protein